MVTLYDRLWRVRCVIWSILVFGPKHHPASELSLGGPAASFCGSLSGERVKQNKDVPLLVELISYNLVHCVLFFLSCFYDVVSHV